MMNVAATNGRGKRQRVIPVFLCLGALALALAVGGCQSLPIPPPLGKGPEKTPAAHPPKYLAYYHYLKAQRFLLADDILGAIAEYQRAAEFDPETAQLQIELAILYQQHGELTKALTHVEKALKIDPKNQEAHFLLAGLHVKRPRRPMSASWSSILTTGKPGFSWPPFMRNNTVIPRPSAPSRSFCSGTRNWS